MKESPQRVAEYLRPYWKAILLSELAALGG